MPDWSELYSEINKKRIASPYDAMRRRFIKSIEKITGRNVIIYYSGWLQKSFVPGVNFSICDADKTGFMTAIHKLNKAKGLDLILHTPGGDMAATESLIDYLHAIFGNNIRAIIPQMAMSGGSMIACACKEILMGAQSSLGPFDPQINGTPCQAILADLNRAGMAMKKDMSSVYTWQPILQKYNLGFFSQCIQAIEMADAVVKKNLTACMFEGLSDAETRAETIIQQLGSHIKTKMHERHIHKEDAKELGLSIIDLEDDQELQDAVLSLHHACILTFEQTPSVKIIENRNKSYITTLAQQ